MNIRHFFDLFNVVKDWRLFVAMIKDKGYKIPFVRKLSYGLLILYIIIPFDFIPGIIPIAGMVDDMGALGVILGLIFYEIASYRDFMEEKERRRRTPRTESEKSVSGVVKSLDAPRRNKKPR